MLFIIPSVKTNNINLPISVTMATILNIETSGNICSVAISKDGAIEYQLEDTEGMKHAERLAPFIEKCIRKLDEKKDRLDAVAVSIGPGSYTGLRIGLSAAKGLCFSRDIPLIGVSTLKLLAVKMMFRFDLDLQGDEILLPMIDARRMEVYTAAYNFKLQEIIAPQPLILTDNCFDKISSSRVIIGGDGSEKSKSVLNLPNAVWVANLNPHARDMMALSEKAFRENDFLDVAYATPEYLKDYQATKPSNKVIGEFLS